MAKVFWYLIVPILGVLWLYQAYAAEPTGRSAPGAILMPQPSPAAASPI